MPVDVKQYVEKLAQEAGASDTEKQALLKVISHEKVSKMLADDLMRHEDYSREMDKLRNQETTLASEKKQWSDWYQKTLTTTQQNEKAVTDRDAIIQAYRTTYGDLDGVRPVVASPASDVVTRKEFEEKMNTLGSQAISITKQAMKLAVSHYKEFGEVLDPDALEKFAYEKNLPLEAAYRAMVDPRLAEKQSKDIDARIAAAREEGRKDALSQANLPITTTPKEPSVFLSHLAKPPESKGAGEADRARAFAQAWNEAGAAAK